LIAGVLSIGPVVISGIASPATDPNYNNGSINILVAPVLGYAYSWVKVGGGWPGSTAEDVQNLTPGSYTVTATNKFSCKATKTFSVLKQAKPTGSTEIIKTPLLVEIRHIQSLRTCHVASKALNCLKNGEPVSIN
jgi:hypothetical protein